MSSSFFDFRDEKKLGFLVDEAVGGVVVVEAPLTDGVAPGIDDNFVDDKESSGSLGKLSVYNILAGLLHRKPTDVISNVNQRRENKKKKKNHYLFSTP